MQWCRGIGIRLTKCQGGKPALVNFSPSVDHQLPVDRRYEVILGDIVATRHNVRGLRSGVGKDA
jgi:hypothetical protein